MVKQNVTNEETYRKNLFRFANLIGAAGDLKQLFNKWDNILALIPEGQEKLAMSKQAILEVQTLLNIHAERYDGLTINNEVIIPGKELKKKMDKNIIVK